MKELIVRWAAQKAYSWDPYCLTIVGSLVWEEKDLPPGETFTVQVTYPNDAYAFDLSKTIEEGDDEGDDWIFGLFPKSVNGE